MPSKPTVTAVPAGLTTFFQTAFGKAIKVAVFVGVSAVAASLLTDIKAHPDLFGGYTALVNAGLVFIEGWLKPTVPTFPGDSAIQR